MISCVVPGILLSDACNILETHEIAPLESIESIHTGQREDLESGQTARTRVQAKHLSDITAEKKIKLK